VLQHAASIQGGKAKATAALIFALNKKRDQKGSSTACALQSRGCMKVSAGTEKAKQQESRYACRKIRSVIFFSDIIMCDQATG